LTDGRSSAPADLHSLVFAGQVDFLLLHAQWHAFHAASLFQRHVLFYLARVMSKVGQWSRDLASLFGGWGGPLSVTSVTFNMQITKNRR